MTERSDDALEADLRRVARLADPAPKTAAASNRKTRIRRLARQLRDERGIAYAEAFRLARDQIDVEDDFAQLGCEVYPEGDGRHDYRITASSYYNTGRDHPDWRAGQTTYRCRGCGDVFVAPDSEMAALDEEAEWGR